jgi:hypothetical protein
MQCSRSIQVDLPPTWRRAGPVWIFLYSQCSRSIQVLDLLPNVGMSTRSGVDTPSMQCRSIQVDLLPNVGMSRSGLDTPIQCRSTQVDLLHPNVGMSRSGVDTPTRQCRNIQVDLLLNVGMSRPSRRGEVAGGLS